MARAPKMQHCFNCGAELGVYVDSDPLDCCGKLECQREASAAMLEERERAHDELDRMNGWD